MDALATRSPFTPVPAIEISDTALAGRKVLLVEDDRLSRRVLAAVLARLNLAVTERDTGESALEAYEQISPDLVVLDVGLPGIDGYETCRRLVAKHGSQTAPILFITAKDTEDDVALGLAAGGSDYVAKPVREKEVIARVRAHLSHRILFLQRQTLLEELSQANQAKNRLLGMAAHDLRNPLASIMALSEMMSSGYVGTLSDQQLKMANLIHKASTTMLGLVNDLLDTASIEAGQLNLKREPADVAGIVALAVDLARISAGNKKTEIAFCNARGTIHASIDPSKIRQVIDNLLSNAIKYSPAGSRIRVEVDLGPNGPFVAVQDEGPGIPASDKGKLFQAWGKLTAQPTAGENSTGLGLSICRRIVEAHGGTISADNLPTKGCEFRIEIPAGL